MRWWKCKAWMNVERSDIPNVTYRYDCRRWAKHWGPHRTTGHEWEASNA